MGGRALSNHRSSALDTSSYGPNFCKAVQHDQGDVDVPCSEVG